MPTAMSIALWLMENYSNEMSDKKPRASEHNEKKIEA
jgi:hypothetical protein